MRVSLNQIKQYIDFELPPVDELVKRINEQLGGVEEVINLGERYKDAKIVHVVECEKHPDADRLNVTKIDAGTGELVQVVCGAPNVHADMWAVWLPPDSTVPSTHGDKEPFVLGARELRGVMSHGMLAAGDELAINGDHDGIIEINPDEWRPSGIEIQPGVCFAEVFGLDDTIIDIENKMFTHRPDLFGQIGVAREIAGILGHTFTSPDWYVVQPQFVDADGLELEVFNDAGENVPRFMAVAMKNIEVKPSPLWLQCALVAMGSKAINNIVDVTNYVMLLTAQPTHAYDYDKIRGHKLGARMAQDGEKATLLNGKTYQLTNDDIVIADAEGPVGLGGIMGGGESEVSADTKNIILEVANFDMYAVRKSSMRHGVFTDALTRFNKGQSALQNSHVMSVLMSSVKDVAPSAEQASAVCDETTRTTQQETVNITDTFINERLGLTLQPSEITNLLENVELHVQSSEDQDGDLEVHPSFWRTDIELPEDVVEEVGRLYGFDKLPRELPQRSTKPVARNDKRELDQLIRTSLAGLGANEVLTYSFVHEKVLKGAGQDPKSAYRVSNALSPDLQYYRLSITPSLLDKVHMNIKAGHDEFALFEIGRSHSKQAGLDEAGVPVEQQRVGFVYASKNHKQGAAYYQAKRYLDELATMLGLTLEYKSLPKDSELASIKAYDPNRRARVVDVLSGQPIAVIGEFASATQKAFKLPDYTVGFELLAEGVQLARAASVASYTPLSRFPSVTQDISLKAPVAVEYSAIRQVARDALSSHEDGERRDEISLVSRYQAEGDTDFVTTTLRIKVTHQTKTLTDNDVALLLNGIENEAQKIGASRA